MQLSASGTLNTTLRGLRQGRGGFTPCEDAKLFPAERRKACAQVMQTLKVCRKGKSVLNLGGTGFVDRALAKRLVESDGVRNLVLINRGTEYWKPHSDSSHPLTDDSFLGSPKFRRLQDNRDKRRQFAMAAFEASLRTFGHLKGSIIRPGDNDEVEEEDSPGSIASMFSSCEKDVHVRVPSCGAFWDTIVGQIDVDGNIKGILFAA